MKITAAGRILIVALCIGALPQHFIANGYETVYCGKIYHARMTDDDHSWNRQLFENHLIGYTMLA